MEPVRVLTDRVASLEEIVRQNGQTFSAMLQRMREMEQFVAVESKRREELSQQLAQVQMSWNTSNSNNTNHNSMHAEAIQQLTSQLQNQFSRLGELQSMAQASQTALRGLDEKHTVAIHALEQRVQSEIQGCHQRLQGSEQSISDALHNIQATLQSTNQSIQVVDDRAREAIQSIQSHVNTDINSIRQRHEALETGMRESLQTMHSSLTDNIQNTSKQWDQSLRGVIAEQNKSVQALDDRVRSDMLLMQQTGSAEHAMLRGLMEETQRTSHEALQASCNTLAAEISQLSQFGQAVDHRQRTAHQSLVQELAKHDQQMEGIDVNWRASVLEVNNKLDSHAREMEELNKEHAWKLQGLQSNVEGRISELASRANEQHTELCNDIQNKCLRPLDEVRFNVNKHHDDLQHMRRDLDLVKSFAQTLTTEVDRGTMQFRQMTEAALRAVHSDMVERLNAVSSAVAHRAEPAEVRALIDQALSKVWSDIRKNFTSQRGMQTINGHLSALEGAVQKEVCALFSQVGQLTNHVQELKDVSSNEAAERSKSSRRGRRNRNTSSSSSSDGSSDDSEEEEDSISGLHHRHSRRASKKKALLGKKNRRASLNDVLALFSTKDVIEKEAAKVHEESVRMENNLFSCNKVADEIKSSVNEAKTAATDAQTALASVREAQVEMQRKLITLMQGNEREQLTLSHSSTGRVNDLLSELIMDNTLNKNNNTNSGRLSSAGASVNSDSRFEQEQEQKRAKELERESREELETKKANEKVCKSISECDLSFSEAVVSNSSSPSPNASLDLWFENEIMNISYSDDLEEELSENEKYEANGKRALTCNEMKMLLHKLNEKFVSKSHYDKFKKEVVKNMKVLHKSLKTLASILATMNQGASVAKVQAWINQSKEEVSKAVLSRVNHHEKSMTSMLNTIRAEIQQLNNNPAYIRVPGGKFGLSMSNIDVASNSTIANDTRIIDMELNRENSHKLNTPQERRGPPQQGKREETPKMVNNAQASNPRQRLIPSANSSSFESLPSQSFSHPPARATNNIQSRNNNAVNREQSSLKQNNLRTESGTNSNGNHDEVNKNSNRLIRASSSNSSNNYSKSSSEDNVLGSSSNNKNAKNSELLTKNSAPQSNLRLPVLATSKRPMQQPERQKLREGSGSTNNVSNNNNNNNTRMSVSKNSRDTNSATQSTSQLARKASTLEEQLNKRLYGAGTALPSGAKSETNVPPFNSNQRQRQSVPSASERKSSVTNLSANNSARTPLQRRQSTFDRLYNTPTNNFSRASSNLPNSATGQRQNSRPSSLSSANGGSRNDMSSRSGKSERGVDAGVNNNNNNNSNSNNNNHYNRLNSTASRDNSARGSAGTHSGKPTSILNKEVNTPTPVQRRKSSLGEERRPPWNAQVRKNSNDSGNNSFARKSSLSSELGKDNVDLKKNRRRPSANNRTKENEARPSSSVSSYVSDASSVQSFRKPTNRSQPRSSNTGNAVRVHPVDKPLVLGTYSTYE